MKTVEAKMVSILWEVVPQSILCSECTMDLEGEE